jgi:hypothetical protein
MTTSRKPAALGDEALDAASGGSWHREDRHSTTGTGLDDHLVGLPGNNFIDGKAGDDTLVGGAGHDNLWGEEGNDSILGGGGVDYMHGGAGDDTFDASGSVKAVIYGGSGTDTVVLDCGGNLMEFRHALMLQMNELGIGCRLLEDGSMRLNYPAGFEGPLNLPGNIVAHDIERIAFR